METLEEAFAAEAVRQLAFLTAAGGFTGPEVERARGPGTTVSVSYRRGPITLEASLVIGQKGKQYAVITGITDFGADGMERRELARDMARSDSQLRRALKMQARAVRRTMLAG